MKIIIFGAGGGIGKHAVTHALNKGYEVTAYLRNPEKLSARAENLTVVKGEITDYAWRKIAISGCDAVVWCIGVNGDGAALAGHKLLIKAMKETGVKRLVDYGTPSYHFEKDQKSMTTWFPGFFAGLAFKDSKKEIISIGEDVAAFGLDWTFVRFIMPTDKEYTGSVKVTYGKDKISFSISRSDIAEFMIEQVESDRYLREMPIIGG